MLNHEINTVHHENNTVRVELVETGSIRLNTRRLDNRNALKF